MSNAQHRKPSTRHYGRTIRVFADQGLELARSAWGTHRAQLLTNGAYAAAIAAAAAALVTQTEIADLVAALIAGSLAISRALRRDRDELPALLDA